MYSNKYGYGVYKRSQVNIGIPYKKLEIKDSIVEDLFGDVSSEANSDPDDELRISQDIICKAKEDAAIIKREAELEADRIIKEASDECEVQYGKIKIEAKEEGYKHGEELALQHYNDLLAEAEEYKNWCKQEYNNTIASLEQDIISLVIEISEKIVGGTIREKETVIIDIIKDTINSCSNREDIVLKVSPQDYDVVVENEEMLRSTIKGLNELEIRKDNTLSKGSCVIDTDFGSVDGSCDVRMENIHKAFFELIGEDGRKDE